MVCDYYMEFFQQPISMEEKEEFPEKAGRKECKVERNLYCVLSSGSYFMFIFIE